MGRLRLPTAFTGSAPRAYPDSTAFCGDMPPRANQGLLNYRLDLRAPANSVRDPCSLTVCRKQIGAVPRAVSTDPRDGPYGSTVSAVGLPPGKTAVDHNEWPCQKAPEVTRRRADQVKPSANQH